jgi:hypothetical protein
MAVAGQLYLYTSETNIGKRSVFRCTPAIQLQTLLGGTNTGSSTLTTITCTEFKPMYLVLVIAQLQLRVWPPLCKQTLIILPLHPKEVQASMTPSKANHSTCFVGVPSLVFQQVVVETCVIAILTRVVYVDGVVLCILTTSTNGSIVHPPEDTRV